MKGHINTSYVMQAKRFFGTGKEYESEWIATTAGNVKKVSTLEQTVDRMKDKSWAEDGDAQNQIEMIPEQ